MSAIDAIRRAAALGQGSITVTLSSDAWAEALAVVDATLVLTDEERDLILTVRREQAKRDRQQRRPAGEDA
jgi:hypothetical protein